MQIVFQVMYIVSSCCNRKAFIGLERSHRCHHQCVSRQMMQGPASDKYYRPGSWPRFFQLLLFFFFFSPTGNAVFFPIMYRPLCSGRSHLQPGEVSDTKDHVLKVILTFVMRLQILHVTYIARVTLLTVPPDHSPFDNSKDQGGCQPPCKDLYHT